MKNFLSTIVLLLPLFATAEVETIRTDRNSNVSIPTDATIVIRQQLGSGNPGFEGFEPATSVGEGIWHAPQYLPSHPTAATLWPRVVDVNCVLNGTTYLCDGYNWIPALGRGEYLYIRPSATAEPVPVEQVTVTVPGPERIILKEVPAKKITE